MQQIQERMGYTMGKVSTFASRLRELLDQKGLSQAQLSQLSGVSKSSITHYLKGDWEGKQDTVYALASAANVSEAWLMGYDVPMEKSPCDALFQTAEDRIYQEEFGALSREEKELALNVVRATPLLSNISPMPRFVQKPRLGTIACGKPILAVEEADQFDMVPENIQCDFTLKCKGDSMINARIYDGDIVYIRSQREVENGEIAAVRVGDEATLKRVYYNGQRVILRACNPLYQDMEFEGEELDTVQVLGKAIAFTSMVQNNL